MQQAGVTPRNPHQRWQFAVEIGGFEAAWFTKSSPVEFENETSRFKPAGSLADQKLPGRMNWSALTLEKGKSSDGTENGILQWQSQIATAAQGVGGQPSDFLRQVDIVEYDRTGTEVRRYRLFGAFISKAALGELEGGSSEPTIETCTLEFQFADLVA